MATFVLCHGGWAGGWQWQEVASLLRSAGHKVFTPTFTGLGERVHLASPDVYLNTYRAFASHHKLLVSRSFEPCTGRLAHWMPCGILGSRYCS